MTTHPHLEGLIRKWDAEADAAIPHGFPLEQWTMRGAMLRYCAKELHAALAALPGGGVEQPKTGTVADYPDADLLRRAVRGAHRGREVCIRWSHIADVFALGSTYSAQLCRRFGLDPNEQVGIPTPNPHEADQS